MVETITPLSLPATMDGTNIALTFKAAADSKVGVVLDFLREKTTANHDVTMNLEDGAPDDADGRLWEITYTLKPNTTSEATKLHPGMAASFSAFDVSDHVGTDTAYLFQWTGVAVPDALEEDRFTVALIVTLDDDDVVARWYAFVIRERGASVSIDGIEAPIFYIQGPAEPNAGETHLEGQVRARVLTPHALFVRQPNKGTNTDLFSWCAAGLEEDARHPNPNQQMQFLALCSMNTNGTTADPGLRKPLYLGTEDTAGYVKDYRHKGLIHSDDEGWFRFGVKHFPSYVEVFTSGEDTDYGNSYATPYPVVTGSFPTGADNHFWYDVCDYYRTRMLALNALPPLIEQNPLRASALCRQPSTWHGFIQLRTFAERNGADLFGMWERRLDACRAALASEHVSADVDYIQVQTYCKGVTSAGEIEHPGVNVENPGHPIRESAFGLADGAKDFLHNMLDKGVYAIAYSRPGDLKNKLGYHAIIPAGAVRVSRDGSMGQSGGSDPNILLDVGAASFPEFWSQKVTGELASVGFRGQYCDSLAGGGTPFTYPLDTAEHDRHGGAYGTTRKREAIAAMKTVLAAGNDPNVVVMSEAVEEFLSDALDITQESYSWYPCHMCLAEPQTRPHLSAVSDLPLAARNLAPPLWQTVYHDRSPGHWQTWHLGNCLLESNSDFYPSGAKDGLTAAEMVTAMSMVFGCVYANGSHPAFVNLQSDFIGADDHGYLVELDEHGRLVSDPDNDPTGAGLIVMRFLKRLHESRRRDYAGQFVMFGKMLRPLQVDSGSIDTVTNPLAVIKTKGDSLGNRVWGMVPQTYSVAGPAEDPGNALSEAYSDAFSVPAVLSQMWEAPDGTVGLVLVNWTSAAADWTGTLDDTLYPITAPYDVDRLVLGDPGNPVSVETAVATGARTISTTGTPDIDLGGAIPAHSVMVLTFS